MENNDNINSNYKDKTDIKWSPFANPDTFSDKNKEGKLTDDLNTTSSIPNIQEKNDNIAEKVAEKVKEDTISQSRLYTHFGGHNNHHHFDKDFKNPEDMVRDWEFNNPHAKLPPSIRQLALDAATVHIVKGRGITVKDIQKNGLIKKDNAERRIDVARNLGLLVPLENRIGKRKQYVLSNYKHVFDTKFREKKENKNEIFPNDVSLLLARELSALKYVYHNIHLQTTLNYNEDYRLFRWPVNPDNQQKVKSFGLEPHRNCSFIISTTGTVNIDIECTLKPFKLHNSHGLVEFFVCCGQIKNMLQLAAANRINVVTPVNDWYLQRFDYNKDLPVKELERKHQDISISWSSKGLLKIGYLGTIFQIYSKYMPNDNDEFLRIDGHYHASKEKVNLVERVKEIAGGEGIKHPFTTAEEILLNQARENATATAFRDTMEKEGNDN